MSIIAKSKIKSDVLKSSNKLFTALFFHLCKNIMKKIKKDCQKKLVKDIKIFLKKKKRKKEKSNNFVVNVTGISQKIK